MKVTINLRNFLIDHYGATLHVPALIEIDEVLDFCDIPGELGFDVHELLAAQKAFAIVWDIRHVRDQRPDLTEAQAWEVLQQCKHDRLNDPMLETIRQTAETMFPRPKAKAALLARFAEIERRISAMPEDEATDPAAYGSVAATLDNLDQALGNSGKE